MYSNWEVVGKKKGKETAPIIKKSGGENKKKNIPTTPKVEEVLPKEQIKNLYNAGKNKENRKLPQEKSKPVENGKKPQKKQEKTQEPQKPKHKSIESALNSLNLEDLKSTYENSKQLFPDAPLIWLKEVVQFLNQRVPVDVQDPTFSSKPERYPYIMIPAPIRSFMDKTIKDAGKNNAQLFFDMSLTAMAYDMSKNLSALGHKFYIQLLAYNDPHFVLTNLSKTLILRNSYQNRQSIGLSILWAVGQAGIKDLTVGLKVFQELMLPLIEMKNYSRFIVQYLINLIDRHEGVNISSDQYLLILDVAFAMYKNFPNDLKQGMQKAAVKLESMLLSNGNNETCHVLVEPLLKKMQSNNSDAYREQICIALSTCLIKDRASIGTWSKCYVKCLSQSAILLNYVDQNWRDYSNKINMKAFKDLLDTCRDTNDELLTKKRKEQGLLDAVTAIQRLSDKMAAKKKKSGFPYKFFSCILIAGIAGVVYYDIKQSGAWNKSKIYNGLNNVGAFKYSNQALMHTQDGLTWLHVRIDEQIPGYYEKTSEFVQPYAQLSKELSLVLCNVFGNLKEAVVEKYPVVIASIESYAPGVLEQSQQAVTNAWTTSVLYVNRGVDYLKTEVFIGQLAPENMHRVVLEALNTTQQKATECYHWIYEKVQSTIK